MFSMFKNNIDIFSADGLSKFKSLKSELIATLEGTWNESKKEWEVNVGSKYNKNESSLYSNNMTITLIKIIDSLSKNNNIGYWSNTTNIANLEKLTNQLDSEKGTRVPEIFNKQSYDLAQLLSRYLNNINLKTDLNTVASAAISNLIDPISLLAVMLNNIQHKIQLYEMLQNNAVEAINMKNFSSNLFLHFTELEKNIANITPETYQASCSIFINPINAMPYYIRICNGATFVNAEEPYKFRPEELYTAGNRSRLINELLASEIFLNEALIKAKLPIVTTVYDNYKSCFLMENYIDFKNKYKNLCENLILALTNYKNGTHLPKFSLRSVDQDKAACAEQLIENIEKYNQNLTNDNFLPSIGVKCFEVFKYILTTIHKNEHIAATKKQALGQLSKILNNFALNFFAITFNETNQTNDIIIPYELKKYEKACGLKPIAPAGKEEEKVAFKLN